MQDYKFLIDTNVFIGLEDDRNVDEVLAALSRKCAAFNVGIFTHDANNDDLNRDKDADRRQKSLSKLSKFRTLNSLPGENKEDLEKQYGQLPKINDVCDARLLNAVAAGAVDFLVSEDAGLRKRASRAGIASKVFSAQEALEWVTQTFEPKQVPLVHIVEQKAHEIPRNDEIFESLKEDYKDFDGWFSKCIHEHRDCWVVKANDEIAGIVIRKDETHSEAATKHPGPKILKVCTFKMKPSYRGEKFGEHLLKQILWFATKNSYDLVYLTAYPKQVALIRLLKEYGFKPTETKPDGEYFLERETKPTEVDVNCGNDALKYAYSHYPHYYDGSKVQKYAVPILAEYHNTLFPEKSELKQPTLFGFDVFAGVSKTPGNTIRKVYLCRSPINRLTAGDLLLFYKSKDHRYEVSQAVVTLGIFEKMTICEDLASLVKTIGRRSVFSEKKLSKMMKEKATPIKVIDFLLLGHLEPPIGLRELTEWNVLSGPPQSIGSIPHERYKILRPKLKLESLE